MPPPRTYAEQKVRIHALVRRIQARLPDLEAVLHELHDDEEETVYRYLHGSFKVFHYQDTLKRAYRLLVEVGGDEAPFGLMQEVYQAATAHTFDRERTNQNWDAETEPILRGQWWLRYFMTQMVRHAPTFDFTEQRGMMLETGMAAVLYLYGLR